MYYHSVLRFTIVLGHDDLVRCYKCGIGFKDFSSDDDDPLHLHASHSPDCPFLCQMFGEDTVTVSCDINEIFLSHR